MEMKRQLAEAKAKKEMLLNSMVSEEKDKNFDLFTLHVLHYYHYSFEVSRLAFKTNYNSNNEVNRNILSSTIFKVRYAFNSFSDCGKTTCNFILQ